ncbi:MAG: hypothetical protein MUO59_03230 [Actinobacteria bacterium]|nr:hypothetical protein [Actinomycetota bacterium]
MPEEKNKIDKLKKAYLYISRSSSVLDEKVKEIRDFIGNSINTETDYRVFWPDSENTDEELESYIFTPSLFSPRKIAVIRNIEKFNSKFQKMIAEILVVTGKKDPSVKGSGKSGEIEEDYGKPGEESEEPGEKSGRPGEASGETYSIVFVLTASSEKINRSLLDVLKRSGSIKRLRTPISGDLAKWLEKKASGDGITFTDEAKNLLIENINLDQNLLKSEYAKLYDYISSEDKKIINGETVKYLVSRVYSMKIFDLVDFLGGRDKNGSLATLEEILSEDSNLMGLITLIHRMFKSMLYIKTGNGTADVTTFLEKNINMPPYFIGKLVSKYIKFSRNYSSEEIIKIFGILNDYDIRFRKGISDNKNLVKTMIARITDIKT